MLISDEVHNDLIMPGHSHVVAPLAMPQAADRLVTLIATTKTFNLAGGMTGSMVIPDQALRRKAGKNAQGGRHVGQPVRHGDGRGGLSEWR